MQSIPELDTPRLLLRGPKDGDFEPFARFYQSEASRTVGGPVSEELAWRNFASLWGHWILRGYGRWTVQERESGRVVGNIGLWNPVGWPEPEIGWTLFEEGQGKGYAQEAARAARSYAYETLGWDTLISAIASDNLASLAVAKRLGARRDGGFEHGRFGFLEVWRHLSPQELLANSGEQGT